VRQPLRDMNQIEERLDTVEAMVESAEIRRQLHDEHLRRLPDLQLLANKLMKEKANLQDCYKTYQVNIFCTKFSIE
jgi:DNA mismatch repair protein MSH2